MQLQATFRIHDLTGIGALFPGKAAGFFRVPRLSPRLGRERACPRASARAGNALSEQKALAPKAHSSHSRTMFPCAELIELNVAQLLGRRVASSGRPDPNWIRARFSSTRSSLNFGDALDTGRPSISLTSSADKPLIIERSRGSTASETVNGCSRRSCDESVWNRSTRSLRVFGKRSLGDST